MIHARRVLGGVLETKKFIRLSQALTVIAATPPGLDSVDPPDLPVRWWPFSPETEGDTSALGLLYQSAATSGPANVFTPEIFTMQFKPFLVAAFCGFALMGNASAQVVVKDAWIRATVPQQKATGAFMQLTAT